MKLVDLIGPDGAQDFPKVKHLADAPVGGGRLRRSHGPHDGACGFKRGNARGVGPRLHEHDAALSLKDLRGDGRSRLGVEHVLHRARIVSFKAYVHLRVVGQNRAHARQKPLSSRAQEVPCAARFGTRNPLALAVCKRRAAVKARGDLHAHPGRAALHAREKSNIGFARLVGAHAAFDLDPRILEHAQAAAGNGRVGIGDGGNDASHLFLDEAQRAGRRSAVVRAGL